MEENKPGKRVAQSAPPAHPARRGLIAAIAVVAALCAVYLALCAYVGSRASALPRTSAAGVDLSGLTQTEAQARLEEAGLSQGRSVTLTVPGVSGSYTVPGSAVVPDAAEAARSALNLKQGGFLTQGWRLLSALVAGNEVEVLFTFTAEGGPGRRPAFPDRIRTGGKSPRDNLGGLRGRASLPYGDSGAGL